MNPYINDNNILVIPFNCDPLYQWWKPGGMSTEKLREAIRNGDIGQDDRTGKSKTVTFMRDSQDDNAVDWEDDTDAGSDTQSDSNIPFPGAYGKRKKIVDNRGTEKSAVVAGDNLQLF